MADDKNRCSTGIHGLDYILNGGLPRQRFYLVQGEPGAGKTTMGLQFLQEGIKLGEKGLYITLSETKNELEQVAISHGWSLNDISILDLTAIEDMKPADQSNTLFHPFEFELSETTKVIMQETERLRPLRLVFDSLSEMRMLTDNPLRYRRQMLFLKQFFTKQNCTVVLLDDKSSNMGDLQINSIAHGVIDLSQSSPEYGAERRRLNILKVRGIPFKGGFHDYVIRTGGVAVFPRLIATDFAWKKSKTKVSSDIENLDKLLDGGIDRGTSSLFIGPAGCGKSTLAMQYSCASAARGEKILFFVFDETVDILISRAEGLGMKFAKYMDQNLITIIHVDPAEMSPGELSDIVQRHVMNGGHSMVILDSLNGYINAMPEERFLMLQLHELFTFLNSQGVITLIIMAQHGLLGAMESPADITYLADTVLLLRYFESEGAMRQAISVMKKRSGNHERTIRELRIDSKGIHVGKPLTEFRGIFTGVPVYHGKSDGALMDDGYAEKKIE